MPTFQHLLLVGVFLCVCTLSCLRVHHQGIDTGAGMVVFDPPVAVATVLRDSDAHERDVQVCS